MQQELILRTSYAHMETTKRKFTYDIRHAYATHTDWIRTHGNAAFKARFHMYAYPLRVRVREKMGSYLSSLTVSICA